MFEKFNRVSPLLLCRVDLMPIDLHFFSSAGRNCVSNSYLVVVWSRNDLDSVAILYFTSSVSLTNVYVKGQPTSEGLNAAL